MSGQTENKLLYERKIDRLLQNESPVLRGFSQWLLMSKSPTTSFIYLHKVVVFLRETDKPYDRITDDDFIHFMYDRSHLKNGKLSSGDTQSTYYHAIARFYEYLERTGKVTRSPVKSSSVPKRKPSDQVERMYLTKEIVNEFLGNIEVISWKKVRTPGDALKVRNRAILMLFITTGIRKQALCLLDRDDIDLFTKTISVIEKGNKRRIVNLSEKTAEALDEWMKTRHHLIGVTHTNAFFISIAGTRLSSQGVIEVTRKYSPDVNGKKISPHKLRAFYAQTLYEKKKDLLFVQRCMGHANSQTTEIYAQTSENSTDEASSLMDDILKST